MAIIWHWGMWGGEGSRVDTDNIKSDIRSEAVIFNNSLWIEFFDYPKYWKKCQFNWTKRIRGEKNEF